jgi:hypothetical protein
LLQVIPVVLSSPPNKIKVLFCFMFLIIFIHSFSERGIVFRNGELYWTQSSWFGKYIGRGNHFSQWITLYKMLHISFLFQLDASEHFTVYLTVLISVVAIVSRTIHNISYLIFSFH